MQIKPCDKTGNYLITDNSMYNIVCTFASLLSD